MELLVSSYLIGIVSSFSTGYADSEVNSPIRPIAWRALIWPLTLVGLLAFMIYDVLAISARWVYRHTRNLNQ